MDIYNAVVPNWFINVSVRLSMVAGFCGVDIYHAVVPNWFINVSVRLSMVEYTLPKRPIGVNQSRGLSPGSGLCASPICPHNSDERIH